MVIKEIILDKVYGITSKLQDNFLPEVIICGKSNVGKSTFINYVSGKKSLARSSSVPGKTRTINFYKTNNSFYLVDLPGYGYAKAPKDEQKKWGEKIDEYLSISSNIKLAILLLDIRHAPGANDVVMYDWLKAQDFDTVIIATKTDKIKRSQIQKNINIIKDKLNIENNTKIIKYSANDKNSKVELLKILDEYVGDDCE